jgi:hypothetical protein
MHPPYFANILHPLHFALASPLKAPTLIETTYNVYTFRGGPACNIEWAPYLESGDGDGAEGRSGRVEEERLRLGDGRPRRQRLTPGRTAGEGFGERGDGGGRRLRSDGQQ